MMKKILITGANSYIGTSFESYIHENYSDDYLVDTIDMIDGTWIQHDFNSYDVVFHVAGIAHIKETKENEGLYYKVNRDLAIDVAAKAKKDGVNHFVFLSSMSIYGMTTGVITSETIANPKSAYGKSKLQAETGIVKLSSQNFKVCVIRPPMVYGQGCKGNYQTLLKVAKKAPIFPLVKNKRSMIEINTLVSYLKEVIDGNLGNIHTPQEANYICTSDMVKSLAKENGKKIYFTRIFNMPIYLLKIMGVGYINKVFGDLFYEK